MSVLGQSHTDLGENVSFSKKHSVIAENLGLGGLTGQNNPNRIVIENFFPILYKLRFVCFKLKKISTGQVFTVALRKLSLIQKLLLIFHLIDFTTILKCGNAGLILTTFEYDFVRGTV